MRFLGSPLGPQSGGLLSKMPNKPGYFAASQQQNYRLRTKDLAHFRVPAVLTYQLNTSIFSCVPILRKSEIWNFNITPPSESYRFRGEMDPDNGVFWPIVCSHIGQWAHMLEFLQNWLRYSHPTSSMRNSDVEDLG